MRRFFHADAVAPGAAIALAAEDERHLFKTLRAVPGDRVEIFDGEGGVAVCEVAGGRKLYVKTIIPKIGGRPLGLLVVAPPRKPRMEQLLRQCAEIGIGGIQPVTTRRGVAEPHSSATAERWRAILVEGCKQSGNPYLPTARSIKPLAAALAEIAANGYAIFHGDPRADAAAVPAPSGKFALLVGPEGGFDEEEERMIATVGGLGVRLGEWTMRVETAAVVGMALLNLRSDAPAGRVRP